MQHDALDFSKAKVSTEFGQIAYVDEGEGPVALFVHGVFLSSHLWRQVIASLRDERRCIALDLPAHGETEVPADHYSITAQADVIEALCEALGLDRVDLVGNDSGGAIAQIFAVRHTERLRTLTLTNCDAHDNLPPPAFKQVVELAAQGTLAPALVQLAGNLEAARSDAGLGSGYEHPEKLSPETIHAYLGRFASAEGAREVERWLTSSSADELLAVEPGLRELNVPTLVVWGTGDSFFDVSWAHWLRDTIPGAKEVVELEGAKLFFPDERPDELVAQLRRHWAAHAAEAQATSR
jgi:pimeloyl-ACP methyl ester carboxylesterase